MKSYKHFLPAIMAVGVMGLASCTDELKVTDPNQQTTANFGYTESDLNECVIAAYNHTRMEGSYARVGYAIDVCRGDEVWNSSQQWYLPFDDLNVPASDEITGWSWREWYYTINVCNFIIKRTEDAATTNMKRIRGQALFLRGLSYYNLVTYYQTPPLMVDYDAYSSLDGLYAPNSTTDEVWDQVEADFSAAMELLPSRDEGGEWAQGRATNGAAAGYYARALMHRHKFSEALPVLKDILSSADGGNQKYGAYKLMTNYGDNFREGSQYENNQESLYEVQYLDYGTQGTDDEWTPVNTSSNATQGHAVESNFGPGNVGGWADLSASPWLYNLFKAERTTTGSLDPRLYWTIGTYEPEWENFEYGNVVYGHQIYAEDGEDLYSGITEEVSVDGAAEKITRSAHVKTNTDNGGLIVAKHTNLRTGLYTAVVTGLRCGINLRLMRYSDVLLRAAECENEVNGPTQQAISWINIVRRRANLSDLQLTDFSTADKLFEQIANVERPKEFGCEYGRGNDLLRWGFFYDSGRLQQLKEHGTFRRTNAGGYKNAVAYSEKATDSRVKSSFDTYNPGHEYLPIYQSDINANPNLKGNSANNSTDNTAYFTGNGWSVRPVVDLSK